MRIPTVENLTSTSTTQVVVAPYIAQVSDLVINCGATRATYKVSPQQDITAFELFKIFQLVTNFSHGLRLIDVTQFIESNNLERHFEKR